MAKVINLNRARKTKARTAAEKLAAENRVRFGRTKAEKMLTRSEQLAAQNKLDGHRLDAPREV